MWRATDVACQLLVAKTPLSGPMSVAGDNR